jgi:hypothetical protein
MLGKPECVKVAAFPIYKTPSLQHCATPSPSISPTSEKVKFHAKAFRRVAVNSHISILFQARDMLTVQFNAFQKQAAGTLNSKNASTVTGLQSFTASTADKKAEEQQSSTRVNLSDFSKRRLQALQSLKSPSSISDMRKAAARAKAGQLKQRIDALKELAGKLGPLAAKGILRQLKQIAQQIRQIASELAEPTPDFSMGDINIDVASATAGGDDLPSDESVNSGAMEAGVAAEVAVAQVEDPVTEDVEETAGDIEAEQAEASAGEAADQAKQVAAEAEKEVGDKGNSGGINGENDQNKGVSGKGDIASQRHARGVQEKNDVEMVKDLSREVRKLLKWVKNMLQNKTKQDKEDIKEIEKQLKKTDNLVQNLETLANRDIYGENIDFENINSAALSEIEASTTAVDTIDTTVSADNVSVSSISVYA